ELVGGPDSPVPAVRHDERRAGDALVSTAGDAIRAGSVCPAPGAAARRVHGAGEERGGGGGRVEKNKKKFFDGPGERLFTFCWGRRWQSRGQTSSGSPSR